MKKLKSVRSSSPTPPWISAPYSHGFELALAATGESACAVAELVCAINPPLAAIDTRATTPHNIRFIRIVLTIESRHRVAAFASLGSLLFFR